MGLIFPLQPDIRHSSQEEIVFKSAKQRFSLGSAFLFGSALIGTLYVAAKPIFEAFWNQGSFLDKSITAFIYLIIFGYIALTLVCWFFEDVMKLKKTSQGFEVEAYKSLFGMHWKKFS